MTSNILSPIQTPTYRDPFNWPAQNRRDCMNLSTVHPERDMMHARTK